MVFDTGGDRRKLILLIAAFAAVYIFWGSTYLAIKVGMETFPPFLMAGSRFVLAGSILILVSWMSPDFEMPRREHWKSSFVVGTLLLLGGNGGVVIATQYIPSSLAALLVATEPFWIVILSWLWLKRGRPSLRIAIGLIVGFIGVSFLITGQGHDAGSSGSFGGYALGTFAVMAGALAWATGSMYGLKASVPKSALLTAGMQTLSGSVALLIVSLVLGEWSTFDISAVSGRSWFAVGYLIVFGSLIGFTAYSWLLKNSQPAMVATYAYVNPVIAVVLGWGIAGESLTGQMLIGAAVVVASVALVTRQKIVKRIEKPADENLPVVTRGDRRELSASA